MSASIKLIFISGTGDDGLNIPISSSQYRCPACRFLSWLFLRSSDPLKYELSIYNNRVLSGLPVCATETLFQSTPVSAHIAAWSAKMRGSGMSNPPWFLGEAMTNPPARGLQEDVFKHRDNR